jgi:hypothetical protein
VGTGRRVVTFTGHSDVAPHAGVSPLRAVTPVRRSRPQSRRVATSTDDASTDRPAERFTGAVKACRDRLVDDVDRHLGVPIIGEPAPAATIGVGDVAAALHALTAAIAALDRDPGPHGAHVRAARDLLDDVRRLLGSPLGVILAGEVTPRQVRLARRRLAEAIDHLTAVMFEDDDQP